MGTIGDLIECIKVMESRHVVAQLYRVYVRTAHKQHKQGNKQLFHKYFKLAQAARKRYWELRDQMPERLDKEEEI